MEFEDSLLGRLRQRDPGHLMPRNPLLLTILLRITYGDRRLGETWGKLGGNLGETWGKMGPKTAFSFAASDPRFGPIKPKGERVSGSFGSGRPVG